MRHPPNHRTFRRGYGLVEVALSCLMLAAALSLSLVGISRMTVERQTIDRRVRADQEAANALERFLRLPWDKRTAESAKSITLDEAARSRLPGWTMSAKVVEQAGPSAGRKVVIEVRRETKPGDTTAEAPIRLVAWTYPTPKGSDPR